VFYAKFEMICTDCQKLPQHLMVKCTHKKPIGNKQLSREVRKQSALSTFTGSAIAETLGHSIQQRIGYFPKDDIDWFVSSASLVSIQPRPKCWFAMFDPNSGDKCHTAVVAGYISGDGHFVICVMDSKQTIEYGQFISFFTDNMVLLHEHFRKDSSVPIIAVVESQNGWTGDVIKERVNYLVHKENVKALANIHFLSDKSKQKHGVMRCGVCVSSPRLNEMAIRMSTAFASHAIRLHIDWVTASELPRGKILELAERQIRRFKHFNENENSGWKLSGQKNNSAKEDGESDDIIDCIGMFVSWTIWFLNEQIYANQRYAAGIQKHDF
jgi:hypothetical protein